MRDRQFAQAATAVVALQKNHARADASAAVAAAMAASSRLRSGQPRRLTSSKGTYKDEGMGCDCDRSARWSAGWMR